MAPDVSANLAAALQLHQAGRAAEAERAYRQVLSVAPGQSDALNLLGVLCLQTGRFAEAERLIERAVRADPSQPLFHLHLGNARHASGKVAPAVESWREALRLQPDLIDARLQLAAALTAAGDADAAEREWRAVIAAAPNLPQAHLQLAQLLSARRHFAEAAEALAAGLRLDPQNVAAHNALGVALSELRNHAAAAQAFARAVELSPRSAPFHMNLGHALRALGRALDAEPSFRRAIELSQSTLAASLHGLAASLRELDRFEEAERAAAEAVRLAPSFAPGYQNLGNIQYELGRLDDAVASHRRSLELNPDDPVVRTGLLLLLHYRHGDDAQLLFDEHLEWGRRHADPVTARAAASAHGNDRDPERPLRVGYVSGDFRDHPVAYFFEPILAAHDASQVHVTLYSNTAGADACTERLRAAARAWHDVRALDDDQLAELIRAHRIDVLVDLSGHIAGNRLLALARRPAPVQVTYLGYPDTTGMRAMDYRFTDAWHDPPGATDRFHTERLVRLEGGAWCFRPRDLAGDVVAPLPGDRNGFVTFFSPNKIAKVTDEMLVAWREILSRVEGARLIVLTGGDSAGDARVRAAMPGLDPARVELVPRTSPLAYFDLYRRADLVLDTFPYNGHTTSCDALWMGLPVVTRAGRTHVTRAGLSLLSKLGLGHFVSDDLGGYVDRAVAAANDRAALRDLRATLRQRVRERGLTDGARLAREIEAAYRQMWRAWCGAAAGR
jgi:predicted O-linked N-acetylglucosamine transferase (SPINDLY family)